MKDTPAEILTLPTPAAPDPKPESAPAPETPPVMPDPNVITPFSDTGEVVRAYAHPKHAGQFILADAAGQVFCVSPNKDKAQLVYEALNGYFQAMAMREAMMQQRKAENAKRIIDIKDRRIITP